MQEAYIQERDYWLGFSVFPGVGPTRFASLLASFSTAENAWNAQEKDLRNSLGEKLTEKFLTFREVFSIEAYKEKLEKKHVEFATLDEETYPSLLKQIKNPPFVLFIKGDFDFNASHHLQTIGVVGTRKITSYGHDVTEMITRDMVVSGYVIVSGLAMGVDATAHKTTIENHGKTVAVLGCGVDCCSPSENTALYDRIIVTGGAIVSEYPLGQSPTKGSFPSRNRIIAGLSQAVVVTEGAADSGALYTADDAFANNRPVFAIPGPITSSLSKGPNSLLVKGAKLVTSGEDILRALGITNQELRKRNREIKGETGDEQVILDLLQNESLHFDELVKQSNKSSTDVAVLLSMMELKGMVKSLENGMFSLDL